MVDLIEEYWSISKRYPVTPLFISSAESEKAFSAFKKDVLNS
jgi:hypothetical protein